MGKSSACGSPRAAFPWSRTQICLVKLAAIILASLVGSCASPVVSAGPLHFGPTKVGTALVDDQGMTLYTYDDDKPGVPTCTGDCAYLWPPELAASEVHLSGESSVVLRPDGIAQWAYDGKPLYRYAGDAQPGDAFGDSLLGRWHVVTR
jgi:predicted lipoprotein with Yx(FWY)xxD motif